MSLYVHRRKAVPGADVTIYKAKECVTGESSKYLNRKQREEALSSLALVTEQLTRMTSTHTSVFTRSGRQKLPTHRKTLGEGGMNSKQSAKLLEVSDDTCYLARLIVPVVRGLAHIWRDCATWWFDRDDLRRESDQVEKSHLAQGKENKASAALCGYWFLGPRMEGALGHRTHRRQTSDCRRHHAEVSHGCAPKTRGLCRVS